MTHVHAVGTGRVNSPGGIGPAVVNRATDLERPVARILSSYLADAPADRIQFVPDMREPHRPATGLVTDPAVVTAIADRIAAETDSTIEVLAREGRHFDLETTSQYLGYGPLLDRESVQLRSITKETDTIELWKHIEGEAVTVDIPEPLLEGDIIPVPTLRPARDGGLAGVTKLLGRTTDPDLYAPATLTATVAIIDPPIAVLDATTTFAGEPVATDALIAGPPFDVDAVGEQLLGRDGQAVGTTDIDAVTVRCDDVDLETVEGAIPSGDYPTTGHSRMLSKGYRLYSRLTGDAYPPHLDPDR